MPNRRTRFAWLAVAALALTAACESQTPQPPSTPSSVAPSPEARTTTNRATPGVSDEAAQNLCSSIQAELSNWRVQGPTLGKPGLNIVVQTWAAQNGLVNIEVLRNRGLVDTITIAHCPDVRQEALELLEIPDLASGLVGI
ncbi:hypothetical protein OG921_05540 [Aldersonia sp. NBC_00410]|uniref:hypothetical protein n=1 Tax=Aldersonia sp. NBC_00410 TaxID=2975954 RepID=UPI002251169E|nr:hypothetical protein [Aldersonia sp. NBC_00410]MCX5042633.1 hypothetical protein [Aldersonia sp. NBC_00410]